MGALWISTYWMVLLPINQGQLMLKPFDSTTTRSTLMLTGWVY
jgi:hypothetical protein